MVEYICRDTEDRMAVRVAGAQAERARRKRSELLGKVCGQADRAGPRMDRWTRHPALPFPEWPPEE